MLNLTRVLALEWATQGVTVNATVRPFATDMNKQLLDDPEVSGIVEKIPMGRWGSCTKSQGRQCFWLPMPVPMSQEALCSSMVGDAQ